MTNGYQPNPADLFHWRAQWDTERAVAWSRLVATFTPEQRELLDQWNNAERQAQLCRDRLKSIEGKHKLQWPDPPPGWRPPLPF